MKYVLLREFSDLTMARKVNEMLSHGWELHGPTHHSVAWAHGPSGTPNGRIMNEMFTQAMVLKEPAP